MVNKFIYEDSEIETPKNSWPVLDFVASPMSDLVSIGGANYHVIR